MTLKSGVPLGVLWQGNGRLYVPGRPYDPALADCAVAYPRVLYDKRFWEMLTVFARFGASAISDACQKRSQEERALMKRTRAARIRDMCVELGPTFIKVGQFLSVRRDLLPLEVAEELTTLQDRVPAFDFDLVRQTITADLGRLPEEMFAEIERHPLASASIGQVHRARLRDGRQVVVKVQRPDLGERFYCDLGYMRMFARLATRLGWGARYGSWSQFSEEFGRTLFTEINYIEEGRNADRLRKVLRNDPRVLVPRVFWKYTGRRVLTLEYLPGTKIDNVEELTVRGLDLKEIGNLLVECYMEQMVLNGFFHADPHPGNLAIDPYGRLVIYDYGMMGKITDEQREALAGCIASVVARDAHAVVSYLAKIGVVRPDARQEPIVRTLTPFLEYYGGRELLDLDFRHLEHEIDQVIEDQALSLPPTLAYLLRAGSSLEGLARTLKPNFSFIAAAKPVIKRLVFERGISHGDKLIKSLIDTRRKDLSRDNAGDQAADKQESQESQLRMSSLEESCARLEGEVVGLRKQVRTASWVAILSVTLAVSAVAGLLAAKFPGYALLSQIALGVNCLAALVVLFLTASRLRGGGKW